MSSWRMHRGRHTVLPLVFMCGLRRAIIQAGIRLVIGHKQMFDRADGRWCESIAYGNEMLREAAVETRLYDGKIGGVTNLFNGERWEP